MSCHTNIVCHDGGPHYFSSNGQCEGCGLGAPRHVHDFRWPALYRYGKPVAWVCDCGSGVDVPPASDNDFTSQLALTLKENTPHD